MVFPDSPAWDRCLCAAVEAAQLGGAIAKRYFRTALHVEAKSDDSPVTVADREAEQAMRVILAKALPDAGFLGEEFGAQPGASDLTWIIDPIDGTKNFVDGVPIFAQLVALAQGDEILLGVCHGPMLGETLAGARGRGVTRNGVSVSARGTRDLAQALLIFGDLRFYERRGIGAPLLELEARCLRSRGFGDFLGHALVTSGHADIMIDPVLSPWDIAPFYCLVEEAGGVITDLSGRRDWRSDSALSASPGVHAQALAFFEATPLLPFPG